MRHVNNEKVEGCCKNNMALWKQAVRRKAKGSQTPGRLKNHMQQAGSVAGKKKGYWAKRSRSYKDRKYGEWCQYATEANRG